MFKIVFPPCYYVVADNLPPPAEWTLPTIDVIQEESIFLHKGWQIAVYYICRYGKIVTIMIIIQGLDIWHFFVSLYSWLFVTDTEKIVQKTMYGCV